MSNVACLIDVRTCMAIFGIETNLAINRTLFSYYIGPNIAQAPRILFVSLINDIRKDKHE